jgi:uncharacterized protein affecting Mg2+/Co2+ transport
VGGSKEKEQHVATPVSRRQGTFVGSLTMETMEGASLKVISPTFKSAEPSASSLDCKHKFVANR